MSPKCRTMSLTSFRVTNILKFWPKLSQHHDDGTNITVPICMKIIPHTNNLTRTIPWLHVFWMTPPRLNLFHKSFLTDFEVETKQKSKKNPFYQGRRYCHDNSWFCEFIKIHTKIKFWNYSLSLDHYIFLFRGEPVSNRTNGQREALNYRQKPLNCHRKWNQESKSIQFWRNSWNGIVGLLKRILLTESAWLIYNLLQNSSKFLVLHRSKGRC